MCLSIPMKVRKIAGDFAEVESGRLLRKVNIQMLPSVKIGEFVLVHAGFAIQRVDPQRARETLRLVDEMPLDDFKKQEKRKP